MPEEKLKYLSVLSTANDVSKPLSDEEVFKQHATKKCRKQMYYRGVSGSSWIEILFARIL